MPAKPKPSKAYDNRLRKLAQALVAAEAVWEEANARLEAESAACKRVEAAILKALKAGDSFSFAGRRFHRDYFDDLCLTDHPEVRDLTAE